MKTYREELQAAQLMDLHHVDAFPFLSNTQLEAIRQSARRREHWVNTHRTLHNAISTFLLFSLLAANAFALLGLGTLISSKVVAALVVSFVHGWLMYGLTNMSLHEGAGHNGLIRGNTSPRLRAMANNVCRLFFADPEFYKSRHVFHHSRFGTSEDGAFTNFVLPRRFLLCLLPLAGILPFNDYKIHAGEKFTRSRIISELLSFANLLGFAAAMTVLYGFWFAAFVLVLGGPWVAFVLDRLRETTEHNLMPTHFKNGARSFGPGFWGFLVGGGPWGQPCHLMHHLAPSLPWYMQLGMHLEVKALMTSEQRRAFMVRPVFGYPLLVAHVLRQTFALSRQVVAADLSRTRAQTPNFGR